MGAGLKTHRAAIAPGAASLEAFPDVVVGDDGRLFLEVSVSTDVVAMIVRVDDEPHRQLRLCSSSSIILRKRVTETPSCDPQLIPTVRQNRSVHPTGCVRRASGFVLVGFSLM